MSKESSILQTVGNVAVAMLAVCGIIVALGLIGELLGVNTLPTAIGTVIMAVSIAVVVIVCKYASKAIRKLEDRGRGEPYDWEKYDE